MTNNWSPEKKKQYQQQYYREHKQKWRQYWKNCAEKAIEHRRQKDKIFGIEFRIWKEFAGPCKCGMSDGRVLEFHHIESEKKEFEINRTAFYSKPLIKLIEELAKCIILCKNCHTIKEYDNGRWR